MTHVHAAWLCHGPVLLQRTIKAVMMLFYERIVCVGQGLVMTWQQGEEKRSVLGFVLCSHPGFGLAVKAVWSASRYTLMLGYCELFIRGWKLNTHGFSFAGIDEMVLCVFRNGKPFQALFQRFYPYIPVQFVTWSLAIRIVSQTWSGPSKRTEKNLPPKVYLKSAQQRLNFCCCI